MNTLHVKRGDTVVVLSGKEKGKTGRILACNPSDFRVQVEEVNLITRHKKAKNAQNTGGRLQDAGFIHSSNVQIVCPSCNKPTRVANKVVSDVKVRSCKHCSASLDDKKVEKKAKKKEKDTVKKQDKKSDKSVKKNDKN
ncbi:MAG: 50S ribosomal protein L24 [Clostridiales bacterium]|jgi:large subunit ribosomal protein L24|nr:50S ribosomal protein L24 [Clostridiales bacterium]